MIVIFKLKKGAEDCVRMKSDGTMNDANCEFTWAGPKKQNIKMGYICEMPTYDRKRRNTENGVPQACQVEYRTRKGAVESIRMNCKERIEISSRMLVTEYVVDKFEMLMTDEFMSPISYLFNISIK